MKERDIELIVQNDFKHVKLYSGEHYTPLPTGKFEESVFSSMIDVMDNKAAYDLFLKLSREFTVQENYLHYEREDFISARGKYVEYKFKEMKNGWPLNIEE